MTAAIAAGADCGGSISDYTGNPSFFAVARRSCFANQSRELSRGDSTWRNRSASANQAAVATVKNLKVFFQSQVLVGLVLPERVRPAVKMFCLQAGR
ncbi:MAG: hypothetical protein JSS27_03075 [Planctomycetes bacterium]|nr:hypothetical protein [Planctomycetota bacterium]